MWKKFRIAFLVFSHGRERYVFICRHNVGIARSSSGLMFGLGANGESLSFIGVHDFFVQRTKILSYCFYSVIISAVVYPISGHWIWGGGWLRELGFHDFAGSTAVHIVGGVAAFIGAKDWKVFRRCKLRQ
ncbi:MAG: ammonium transporter [Sphaerochaeta sp.]|nr:ammonium transporter [Sphaerochaeta sp.]